MTPVGKLDTAALPAPVLAAVGEFVEPVGEAELWWLGCLREVLGVERVGALDSFFDLGGNSLSATRVVARVGEALGVGLGVRDVFEVRRWLGWQRGRWVRESAVLPAIVAVDVRQGWCR